MMLLLGIAILLWLASTLLYLIEKTTLHSAEILQCEEIVHASLIGRTYPWIIRLLRLTAVVLWCKGAYEIAFHGL